jgi:hypothetical protein
MATTASTIHMYDSGVQFLITVEDENGPVDLTTAQNVTMFFQKPDKSVVTNICTIINAAVGLVSYVSTPTDFDQIGRWSIQVVVRFADNDIKHSDIGTLTVLKNLA